jgi:hypothetical protein
MRKLFSVSAHKDTTKNPNLQVFMQKNDVYVLFFVFLHKKSVFFATLRKELKRNLQISNIFCIFAI